MIINFTNYLNVLNLPADVKNNLLLELLKQHPMLQYDWINYKDCCSQFLLYLPKKINISDIKPEMQINKELIIIWTIATFLFIMGMSIAVGLILTMYCSIKKLV